MLEASLRHVDESEIARAGNGRSTPGVMRLCTRGRKCRTTPLSPQLHNSTCVTGIICIVVCLYAVPYILPNHGYISARKSSSHACCSSLAYCLGIRFHSLASASAEPQNSTWELEHNFDRPLC